MVDTVRVCVLLLCLGLGVALAYPAPLPFEQVIRSNPGEPWWAIALRLRAADSLASDPRVGPAYLQFRSQNEALVGDHHAALQFDDLARRRAPNDSVGVLPHGARAVRAVDYLSSVADTARVIMINERHHADSDRLLTLELLPRLRAKGYRYFAAEALDESDTTLAKRGYPIARTGSSYVGEPVFAEVVREALRLGFVGVPYECLPGEDLPRDSSDTRSRQARRDSVQAAHLVDRIFRRDPDAKLLVHAGYAHIQEQEVAAWRPMAAYFRRFTAINPVTVDQTALSERGDARYERPLYRAMLDAAAGNRVVFVDASGAPLPVVGLDAIDLQVVSPRTTYDQSGRPTWMRMRDRRSIRFPTPEARTRWCMVEAHAAAEPDSAIALDRAEVDRRAETTLYLPPGTRVRIRVLDAEGATLRTTSLTVGR